MGALIDQSIPTLFGGVSRQPHPVRRSGQVQEADNALLSVVTGGFEKRPPTQHLATLSGLDSNVEYGVFSIDRDPTEQYMVLIDGTNGGLSVYNAINGSEVTVNIGDTKRFWAIDQAGLTNSTGAKTDTAQRLTKATTETAFDWAYAMDATSAVFKLEGSPDGVTWYDLHTGITGASGTFTTTVGLVVSGDHNNIRINVTSSSGGSTDELTLHATFKDLTYLRDSNPEDFALTSVADFTFIVNKTVIALMEHAKSGTITSTVQEFSDLPTNSGSGNIHGVTGTNLDGFGTYYVRDDPDTSTWVEVADPTGINDIAQYTMPHQLVREADGTFTYSAADWKSREVGDILVVPEPPFIGRPITDVTFFGGRLTLSSDETVYLGQQGDTLNMWPQKATQQQDTDPIDRSSSTTSVTILNWLTVFRKLLFATAVQAQFELTNVGSALTPTSASFDRATSYPASQFAKPATMGDLLYFAASTPNAAILYEYLFDDTSLSNTAIDVTRHVANYVPAEITEVVTDPTTGTVFVTTSGEPNSIFVYRVFFDGSDKIQSAWAKYKIGATASDAFVHGIAVFSGFLVLVVERPDGFFLEQIQIEREADDADLGFIPLIDQRTVVTGVYDSGTNLTTWTSPYEHDDDLIVVLGGAHTVPGTQLNLSYPTATTATAVGDFSAGGAYVGRPYEMNVELSKLFYKEEADGPSIINGRFQVRDISFSHENTGYYKVVVTPVQRDPNTFEFTGRILGDGDNQISAVSIDDTGKFKAGVMSNGETVKIEIKNDTPLPCVITSATLRAFFNEVSRQG